MIYGYQRGCGVVVRACSIDEALLSVLARYIRSHYKRGCAVIVGLVISTAEGVQFGCISGNDKVPCELCTSFLL